MLKQQKNENLKNNRIDTLTRNLPFQLRAYSQFVGVKLIESGRTSKPKKIPIHPVYGTAINFLESEYYIEFDQAVEGFKRIHECSGVGCVLNGTVGCIDLDNCIEENGCFSKFAKDCIALCPGSYIEISHSGTGLHIFGCFHLPNNKSGIRHKSNCREFEIYLSKRYILVTGEKISDSHSSILSIQPLVDKLLSDVPLESLGESDDSPGSLNYGETIAIDPLDWEQVEALFFSPWTMRQFDISPKDPSLGDYVLVKEALRNLGRYPTAKMRPILSLLVYRYRERHGNDVRKALRLDYLQRTVNSAIADLDRYTQKSGKSWLARGSDE